MIPKYLSFQAFGPYLEKQEIDFTTLAPAGLFLIYGETGAGKTAILDAVTYALFGMSSGGARGDITGMRSGYADDDNPTVVEYVFSIGGRDYKFTRTVAVHIRKDGRKEFRVGQNAFFRNQDGEFEPFFENPKIAGVRQKAEELLGLSYDQFRQVILLPQGQFEKLLVADSAAKEQILVTLFGAEKWQRITDWLCDRANAMKRANEEAEQAVRAVLAAQECEDAEGLKALLERQDALLADAQTRRERALVVENAAAKQLADAQAVKRTFDEYAEACQKRAALEASREASRAQENLLRRAADADRCKPLRAAAARLAAQKEKREKEAQDAERAARQCTEQTGRALETLAGLFAFLRRQAAEARNAKEQAEQALSLARQEYERRFAAYLGDMAGVLAGTLAEGAPCPVCGSTHHPRMSRAKAEAQTAAGEVRQAEQQIEQARAARDAAVKALVGAEHRLADCENAMGSQVPPGDHQPVPGDLHACVNAAQEAQRAEDVARAALASARRELKSAAEEFERAMEEYRSESEKYGFASDAEVKKYSLTDEQAAELRQKLDQYNADLAAAVRREQELAAKTEGKTCPELAGAAKAAQEAAEARRRADGECAALSAQADLLSRAAKQVEQLSVGLERAKQEYAELDGFARLLRGDLGVGLKRYVLGVMLSSVTHEANRLLQKVHDGRYQLYRTTEGTGRARKVGLDLEVFDANTGERRGVTGLSGGEKFLVSLSLSLGLAAVVQAQSGGIRIDAMFIDEGFGSLDPASIENALQILAYGKGSARLVGIISHVQALRENIEASIRVKKTRRGSSLFVSG